MLVADAVSFEFNDINITAQHVMTQRLSCACMLAFHDQFIKDDRDNQLSAH